MDKSSNIKSFRDFNENSISKESWWNDNYKRLIDLDIPYEEWKSLIKHESDFEGVYNSTAKNRSLYLLNTYSIDELEELINDYNLND
jgi:hypothetical protein